MENQNLKIGTEKNWDEIINQETPIIIDFWAPWCPPCKFSSPIFEKLSQKPKYQGKLLFVKVNVDENPTIAQQYGVMSIPTFIILKNKEIITQFTGAMPETKMEQKIDQTLNQQN